MYMYVYTISYPGFFGNWGISERNFKKNLILSWKPCSHVRIVPPTLNMAYMYLKENVSQAFRKTVMFTNHVKLKDNPLHKWNDFMIYT